MDPSDKQRSSRLALPEGTLPVGIGLLIAGVTAYLFLKVAKVALGSDEAVQPIASLWIATFAWPPASSCRWSRSWRATLAQRRALDQGGKPVVSRVVPLAIGLAGLVTRWRSDRAHDHQPLLRR